MLSATWMMLSCRRVLPTMVLPRAYASASGDIMVRDALNMALDEEIQRDDRVFLMGEEVGQYHGAYKVSKGLLDKHGSRRVIDTPITEAGFTGLGVGAGMHGLRPVIEFMTWNFALQAIDHIINSCAKGHYMSAGKLTCPIVFRGPNGSPGNVGAQHSQCFGAWYSNVPGLKVVAPYDSVDAKALLKACIRDNDPCVFLESEVMYGTAFPMTPEQLDPEFVLPIGKAHVAREGTDITLTAFGRMVGVCLQAAARLETELGISCEVLNLRTLRPLDKPAIVRSVAKTNHLINVEEGWPQCGLGAEILATLMEGDGFDLLDAPAKRITGADVPMAYNSALEVASQPQVDNVVNQVRLMLRG